MIVCLGPGGHFVSELEGEGQAWECVITTSGTSDSVAASCLDTQPSSTFSVTRTNS